MSVKTSLKEKQSNEQGEGFWRQFRATIRAHLLTTILITIIVALWSLVLIGEDNARERVAFAVDKSIKMVQAENAVLTERILDLRKENEQLKEEIERLKKELAQRK